MRALYPRAPGMELIRFGTRGDGGYLVPDDMDGVAACFSPGVGDQSSFELDCADAGMRVFMADNSVSAPFVAHDNFYFVGKNIGVVDSEECMTMDKWVEDSLGESAAFPDMLLQMDVEGDEYAVLLNMSPRLMRGFRIIVAEVHGLNCLFHRPFFNIAARAFERVLQTHVCVHIHPNNLKQGRTKDIPPVMEFTFLRRDRVRGDGGFARVFPHPLDCENSPHRPPLPLPACWYDSR